MSIKYGELTIIYDKEETTLFTSMLMLLNYEGEPPKSSKYVFLFEDGEICESADKYKDFQYKFCMSSSTSLPLYFKKTIKHKEKDHRTYFYKTPENNPNNQNKPSLDFRKLFTGYSKYRFKLYMPSIYNSIFYCYKSGSLKPEVFGILRITSNEYMPRFQFAYDSDEFTREEIVYFIRSIFNPSMNSNKKNV